VLPLYVLERSFITYSLISWNYGLRHSQPRCRMAHCEPKRSHPVSTSRFRIAASYLNFSPRLASIRLGGNTIKQ